MQPLLQVKNLTVGFSGNMMPAVDNISFHLNQGETLGIVGESGSGKSVTALSLMQLVGRGGKISGGEILFNSSLENKPVDLLHAGEKEMCALRGNKIAMIFQEPMNSLNPVICCGKQVDEAILLHQKVSKQQAREQTIELFKKVNLPRPEDLYNAYPHQLSGGQLQRVMIAMAISCNPSILIADEPTTALDATVQQTILELLKNLQQQTGMSIIFISHDLNVVAGIAHRVAVMHKGKIVEEGNIKTVYHNPVHPYTKGLLACRPPMDKKLKRLPTINDFTEEQNGTLRAKKTTVDELIDTLTISKEKAEKLKHTNREPMLEVENLKKYFQINEGIFLKSNKQVKAVDDVSFKVYVGETLGIVGESGSGKTTLGRVILQLINSTHGKVLYDKNNLIELSADELKQFRKRVQVIFQDPYSALNPHLTIGEAVMEPMVFHKLYLNSRERKIKTIELLNKVGLSEEHFSRLPAELSGGQRQRVCIARALAVNPEFIICDEAVSALDVSVQAQVLNLLNDLKKDFAFTCIFISHDLPVVKFMSDRIMVMKNGKIEEEGSADEIYFNPKSEYTKQLIKAIPVKG